MEISNRAQMDSGDPCIDVTERPCVCVDCTQPMWPTGRILGDGGEVMECRCPTCGTLCVAELLRERTDRTWMRKESSVLTSSLP